MGCWLAAGESCHERSGTDGYMAPEVISRGPSGFPADIFALGVVMYALLSGQMPLGDEHEHSVDQKLQEQMCAHERWGVTSLRRLLADVVELEAQLADTGAQIGGSLGSTVHDCASPRISAHCCTLPRIAARIDTYTWLQATLGQPLDSHCALRRGLAARPVSRALHFDARGPERAGR